MPARLGLNSYTGEDNMATSILNKQQIEELLDVLDDQSLRRTHNSVNISFAQMLEYIDSILRAKLPKDIELLLRTYTSMAPDYFTQFELTLLQSIERQRRLSSQAQQVMGQINARMADIHNEEIVTAMETAKGILQTAGDSANDEENNLKKSFPALLQNALDKLRREWQRLNTIAIASKTITKDEKLIEALDAVVEAARFSVGTKVARIAVVPGEAFALQFYAYLKNFAVLTVPIYSVQAPWEWSIFWHELAGDKVRRLEKDTATEIESVREALKMIHRKWKAGDKEYQRELLEFLTRNNQYSDSAYQNNVGKWKNNFSLNYLRDFFSNDRLNWRDLGGLEHQFERMLERLAQKTGFSEYEQLKAQGWCVDWFKELFEDAWSVLAIREPFMDFLEDVLNRHAVEDGRHPLIQVRLDVAKKLLELMDSEEEAEAPETVIESAAQQILKFIALLTAPSLGRVFELLQSKDSSNYWLTFRPQLSDLVGGEIGKYITTWSKGLNANISRKETREYAEEFIKELSSVGNFSKSLNASIDQQLNEIKPTYDELLIDKEGKLKDYKQLLDLSFYDVDFAVGFNPIFIFRYLQATVVNTYKITSENLNNALDPARGFIKKFAAGDLGDKVNINNNDYLITKDHFDALLNIRWVEEV
jgi:hypothetical protein